MGRLKKPMAESVRGQRELMAAAKEGIFTKKKKRRRLDEIGLCKTPDGTIKSIMEVGQIYGKRAWDDAGVEE